MLNKHQSQKLENEFSIAQTNKEYFKGMPVEITWGNGLIFKGYIQRKLRKNFEVRIPKKLNKHWYYPNEIASVPARVMKRITPEEMEKKI